jgi:hypothetical protein
VGGKLRRERGGKEGGAGWGEVRCGVAGVPFIGAEGEGGDWATMK